MRLFEDTKSAVYGIHQIALMGESMCGEKKAVGTWFGPNMVAQVLRLELLLSRFPPCFC